MLYIGAKLKMQEYRSTISYLVQFNPVKAFIANDCCLNEALDLEIEIISRRLTAVDSVGLRFIGEILRLSIYELVSRKQAVWDLPLSVSIAHQSKASLTVIFIPFSGYRAVCATLFSKLSQGGRIFIVLRINISSIFC